MRTWKTAAYTRAYAETTGFLTLLSDGERLTGAYALGPEAGEWLEQATLAIRARVPLDVLRDTIQPFPTFSEIYLAAINALCAEIAGGIRSSGVAMSSGPQLAGQTVVVIGGTSGIGLETARRARAEGADVVITARNPDRLQSVGLELGAPSTAAFDAPTSTGCALLRGLAGPIDHVMLTGPAPVLAPLAEFDLDEAPRATVRGPHASCRSRSLGARGQDARGRHAALHRRRRRPWPAIGFRVHLRPSPPRAPRSRRRWRSSSRLFA